MMGDSRPNSTDGVVAELVTEQVHEHPELPLSISGTPRRSPSRAPSGTAMLTPRRLALPAGIAHPHLRHHTSFCRGATPC